MRILIVGETNTSASALAAGFLYHESRLRSAPVTIASAGFGASGSPIDPRVTTLLADRGVDMSRKRSRAIDTELVDRADLVATMTASQAKRLRGRFPELRERVVTLGDLAAGLDTRPRHVGAKTWVRTFAVDHYDDPLSANGQHDLLLVGAEADSMLLLADRILGVTGRLASALWPVPGH